MLADSEKGAGETTDKGQGNSLVLHARGDDISRGTSKEVMILLGESREVSMVVGMLESRDRDGCEGEGGEEGREHCVLKEGSAERATGVEIGNRKEALEERREKMARKKGRKESWFRPLSPAQLINARSVRPLTGKMCNQMVDLSLFGRVVIPSLGVAHPHRLMPTVSPCTLRNLI